MKKNPARRVAFTGMLLALAAALSFLEGLLPVTAMLPPGVRLGLSNIVTMYALFFLGKKEAFAVAAGKSLFVLLTRAPVAALLSFCGGMLSILVMLAVLRRKDASYMLISTAGAVAHNVGQLCASVLVIGSAFTFWYLPVLVLSGAAMGVLTSVLLKALLPLLRKIHFVSQENFIYRGGISLQGFGKHLSGAKVPHNKHTSACATEEMPVPARVIIPMAQSIGASCTPLVKKGDTVKVGQKIGDSEAFFSVPVHSSVSGTVASVDDFVTASGAVCQAVVIDTDGEQTVSEEVGIPEYGGKEAFLREVRNSGLVGLGGAAFPTFIKLNPKNPDEVDTLIVNAAECEPYITSDLRAMLEDTDLLIAGIRRVAEELNFKKVIIGIEDNKPEAVEVLKPYCDSQISLCVLPSKYPKGGEKVLIYEATGKVVAEGQLPADVGVIVMNVTSVITLETYFETGMPLVGKRVTVDGGAVAEPKNVRAPIGTLYSDLIAFCGGYKEKPAKILQGGPMMGIAVPNDSQPLLKNNNAVLVLTAKECETPEPSPCIRCGRCLRACPFGLMPAAIDKAVRNRDVEQLRKLKVNLCMECGCCSYVCPASRPLVQQNKLGKQILKNGGGK